MFDILQFHSLYSSDKIKLRSTGLTGLCRKFPFKAWLDCYRNIISSLIIQWGIDLFLNTGTTITFPVAFTTKNYSITSTPTQNDDTVAWCIGLVEEKPKREETTFTAYGWNVRGTMTVYSNWLAIGY